MFPENPNWRLRASCRDLEDKEIPFGDVESAEVRQFVAYYCGPCPVVNECLRFAEETGCNFGVYGGKLPKERRVLYFNQKPLTRCGTRQGYRRHRHLGEKPCDYCIMANRQYDQDNNHKRKRYTKTDVA